MPKLVVVLIRFGSRGGALNISDTGADPAKRVFDICDLVQNGRGKRPITIESADDFDPDDAEAYHHAHLMSLRASDCPVFADNKGQSDDSDHCLMSLLQRAEDHAAAKGLQGDERPMVTYVVAGIDSWTTDIES